MIGVVVPAHNEEAEIEACVRAARIAAVHPGLSGEAVEVVVVLDSCTDLTGQRAKHAGATTLTINAHNVGSARHLGARHMLERGARWLAFTDADTLVSPAWLSEQLLLKADAVCGTVEISDWSPHDDHATLLKWHFSQTYCDHDDHRHVHGANLGVDADAYQSVGGFAALATSEDVALVRGLVDAGFNIAWSARPRVITSSRRDGRAPGGFAQALLDAVAQRLTETPPCPTTRPQ